MAAPLLLPDTVYAAPSPTSPAAVTSDRLVEHARTLLHADGIAFLRVDGQRRAVGRGAEWFSSPELRLALTAGSERPHDGGSPGIAQLLLVRDRPLLLPRVDAWEAAPVLKERLASALGEPRVNEVWRSFGPASLLACAVKTAAGRPLGVLAAASLRRRFTPDDLRAAEVLADLGALALERSELLAAEAARARQEVALERTAAEVVASLDVEEVYRQVVAHAVELTGASKALLTRLDARAGVLRPVATVGFSDGFAARRLPIQKGMLERIVSSRRPYIGREPDAGAWDTSVTVPERIGSFMHAPIELGPRLLGVLTVSHEQPGQFNEGRLDLLVRMARSSAAAIANALDYQRERRTAEALTLGFVPQSLPELAGCETGLHYAPAADAPTGGDLYGVWDLPAGEVALLVGDVAGKGVETAALSAMARFFIEARCWDSSSPAHVLRETNLMLHNRLPSDTFITAFLAVLSDDHLRWCNAGHHPPLLVSRGTPAELTGHGLPLGIEPDVAYGETFRRLEPGDVLLAYTDGVIEAGRGRGVYGAERLAALIARKADLPPQELAQAAHDDAAAFAGGLSDDAVALALKRSAA